MCGIAGWVSYEQNLKDQQDVVEHMRDSMSHRGPDADGIWVSERALLGHQRLSIIDLEGGGQPMDAATPEGRVSLVFSGEIYNFQELRHQLELVGHRFFSRSDTEVVLRAYLEWGIDAAVHLNGMFAFAIWDERDQMLLLCRDRMGIKPLYYSEASDGILFASEAKAILAHPSVRHEVRLEDMHELVVPTAAPGWCLWNGIREVEPATVVIRRATGTSTRTYWSLSTSEHADDAEATAELIRSLLIDTVQRQLVADVPICALLSGGLDSSAITGIAAVYLARQNERLRTFSVDFGDPGSDFVPDDVRGTVDMPYAIDMAAFADSVHQNISLAGRGLADESLRRAVIAAKDAPAGLGDLDASLLLLFRSISTTSKVAISGEAADEVFGGYPWFQTPPEADMTMFPWIAFDPAIPMSRFDVLHHDIRDRLRVKDYVAGQYAEATADIEHIDGASDTERRARVSSYLHLTREVRNLLDRKDRLSMAVGLEVRVPFCDHRLVQYAYNIPWHLKTFDGREKSILRKATRSFISTTVAARRKSGYPLTQDATYTSKLKQQLSSVLAENDASYFEIVDRAKLTELCAMDTGVTSNAWRFSSNLALDIYHWLRDYRPSLIE